MKLRVVNPAMVDVIPAQAGIQCVQRRLSLDSRLRGIDGQEGGPAMNLHAVIPAMVDVIPAKAGIQCVQQWPFLDSRLRGIDGKIAEAVR